MEYRRKSEVIDAFQMTEERRWDSVDWPEWLNKAWSMNGAGIIWPDPDNEGKTLVCGTHGNITRIAFGDWIIHDAEGKIRVCKPERFEAFYEEVVGESRDFTSGDMRHLADVIAENEDSKGHGSPELPLLRVRGSLNEERSE